MAGMRLSSVDLTRFKAFEKAHFDIAPLTVLIGPNNAGKSSLLHALAVLGQSAQADIVQSTGSMIDLGRDPLLLTHASDRAGSSTGGWELAVQWEGMTVLPATDFAGEADRVEFRVRCPSPGNDVSDPPRTSATVQLPVPPGRSLVVSVPDPHDPQSAHLHVPGEDTDGRTFPTVNTQVKVKGAGTFDLSIEVLNPEVDTERLAVGDPTAVSLYGFLAANRYLHSIPQALRAYRYVGADRTVNRSLFFLGAQAVDHPRSQEQVVDTLAYNRAALRGVSSRCEQVFEYGIELDLVPERQVQLMATRGDGRSINVVNLGSGFIQLIWIVLELELARLQVASSENQVPAVVGLEEPEVHLHPGVQPDVARVIVDYVRQGTQVICTTQSEHFLMSLLQMVLEGSLDPAALAVYYVDRGTARRLDVDEQGRLSEGIRGFFEANEEQLKRHIELLIRRD